MIASGELAIDAGQTGTKVRFERDGASAYADVLPGVRTHEPLLPQLAETVLRVREASGGSPATVSYGVSGLTREGADARALLGLLDGIGVRRVLLAHDSITSFLGTLGDDYAVHAMPDLLTAAQGERHATELAHLRGARMVVCSETEELTCVIEWLDPTLKNTLGTLTLLGCGLKEFKFGPKFEHAKSGMATCTAVFMIETFSPEGIVLQHK